MDEFELIRRYFKRRPDDAPGVALGIGDDAAVTRPPSGEDLVIATDTIVEGTHFRTGHPASSLGHRALAVNLSDLAAMGARPLWFTLALSLPDAEPAWLEDFAGGLFALAERYGIALIGGDTVRGPLAVTITAIGAVPAGRALRRSGAEAGDAIYVSGSLGDAGYAWRAQARGESLPADDPALRRYEYPQPRIDLGLALRDQATAAIDLSDGLQPDLGHVLSASGLGADCDADLLPVSPALRAQAGDEATGIALTGGDDYELCFTVPANGEAKLPAIAGRCECELTRIGTISARPGLRWIRDGRPWSPPTGGFTHFTADST